MTVSRIPARTIIGIGAAIIVTVAGCGGDDDSADTTMAPAATATATDAPAAAATDSPAATATDAPVAANADAAITIAGFAFSGVTDVTVGTTVTITNTDSAPHTWSADDGAFDSGSIAPGGTFEFTFTEAGTFAYHCNFHPSMSGTITVTG